MELFFILPNFTFQFMAYVSLTHVFLYCFDDLLSNASVKLNLDLSNFVSGGYFHGVTSMTYGVDVGRIRWLGILQVNYY